MCWSNFHTLLLTLTVLWMSVEISHTYESCQTLNSEIVVTKERTYDYNGRPLRLLCVGTVNVKKCEGTCSSQVSPSVVKFPGFLKDCRCCREGTLVERLVTLSECYDGTRLVLGELVNMYIKEPTDCQCFDCDM